MNATDENSPTAISPAAAWLGLALLAGWAAACAAAMQGPSPAAARAAIGAAWLAIAFGPLALPWLGRNPRATNFMLGALALLWFAGFDSPFHWDAVQTVIRAEHFWHAGEMERFSILFAVMAPVVAAFPASAVAPHLFMMTCGLGAAAAIALMTRRMAGRVWARRAFLLTMVFPPLWLLYRFVMLEAFLVLMWSATLLAALAWARRLTPPRATGLAALVLLTAAAKETGALVVVPVVTALVALAPRAERRRRWIMAGGLLAVAAVIGLALAARFAQLRHIDSFFTGIIHTDRGLTFLPFNPHLAPSWIDTMLGLSKQHMLYWTQTGLVVPVVLAFVRPRSAQTAAQLVGAGIAAQVFWIVMTRHHIWPDVHTYPLFNPRSGEIPAAIFFLFATFVFLVVSRGEARWECDRRKLVLVMGMLPFLVALMLFAKTQPAGGGKYFVWLQWHYLSPAVVGMLVIAVMGLRRVARWPLPPGLRWAAGAALTATVASGMIGTLGFAAQWRDEDLARQEAYELLNSPASRFHQADRKTVSTHWPFAYIGTGLGYHNNGPLAWERDGWRVMPLSDVATTGALPLNNSVMLFDVSRSYGIHTWLLEELDGHATVIQRDYWRPSLWRIAFPVERRDVVEMLCMDGPCVSPDTTETNNAP